MFYLEDDSEDEEKVHKGILSKTQAVYHGKAPPGILVSFIHPHPAPLLECSIWVEPPNEGD